jgi:hypothetical protein
MRGLVGAVRGSPRQSICRGAHLPADGRRPYRDRCVDPDLHREPHVAALRGLAARLDRCPWRNTEGGPSPLPRRMASRPKRRHRAAERNRRNPALQPRRTREKKPVEASSNRLSVQRPMLTGSAPWTSVSSARMTVRLFCWSRRVTALRRAAPVELALPLRRSARSRV